MKIRIEDPEDYSQVRNINKLAFETAAEANIVDKLRKTCPNFLSFVACDDNGNVLGHILFSTVVVESSGQKIEGMGLAPMAVLPDNQRQGIGKKLVSNGIESLKEQGCPFIIVLGHPEYYPRFGFEPASKYGLSSQWEGVPDEAFMVLVMDNDSLKGITGVAKYRDEFNEAM